MSSLVASPPAHSQPWPLSREDFELAARLLHERAGIVLGAHKIEMAARALGARALRNGLDSISAYLAALRQSPQSAEWELFVNAFTINHTAFFRERHHFDILAQFVAPRTQGVAIWCCAASTGEEAYSIAMTLHESMPAAAARASSIWATDIDTQAIQRACTGEYTLERVQALPADYLKKYFYKGRDTKAGLVRVKPVLADMIRFEPFNLLSPQWPTAQRFDAIFCRNTMIYFDKPTQTRILERFAPMLKPDGLLFAGHSENFTYLTRAFQLRGKTVYALSDAAGGRMAQRR